MRSLDGTFYCPTCEALTGFSLEDAVRLRRIGVRRPAAAFRVRLDCGHQEELVTLIREEEHAR